jgi:hypothetical protein
MGIGSSGTAEYFQAPRIIRANRAPDVASGWDMASELNRTAQAALADLTEGKYPSLRAAAAAYSLNYTTLANRRREGFNRRGSHSNQQILPPEQEDRLVR